MVPNLWREIQIVARQFKFLAGNSNCLTKIHIFAEKFLIFDEFLVRNSNFQQEFEILGNFSAVIASDQL